MEKHHPSATTGRIGRPDSRDAAQRIAIGEYELASRWGLSVKTLRRWRQEQLGPVFCKLGSRVTYLISEVESFERRVSRCSTSARAYV
ncbi:MAG: DNA-binding protein [Rhodocyclaceae bacterium]|nr:MAG: DNA-binding protein [Rhodocyclaceae bacterium]